MTKVQDCKGLPVPTAAATLVALGSRPLLLIPPSAGGPAPASLLPPEAGYELVHPDAVAALGDLAKDAVFRQVK